MSWPSLAIGDIAEVVTKGTTPTTLGRPFVDHGVNFVKAEALNGDAGLDQHGFAFIDEETHQLLQRSILKEDDVLITIAGAKIGKCGYVKPEILPANTNQAVGIVRVNKLKAVPRFVYYFFKQPAAYSLVQSMGAQAAQPNLNLSSLKKIRLPLPTVAEQQRIAFILSAYDYLIENNRRRIQLLEQAARLLYKEWFVHFRFPGHEHVKIKDGVLAGWERKTAFDVMDVLSGGTPKTNVPGYWEGDIPFYTPKDSADYAYVFSTEKTLTEDGLRNCNSKLYPKDTIFITARGTVGKINLAQTDMAMNQSCYALLARKPLTQYFLFFALVEGVNQFRSRAVGAVFNAIIVDTFRHIPFLVPREQLIQTFTDYVSPILRQVEALSTQTRKLTKAREILLPRLMNGEIQA